MMAASATPQDEVPALLGAEGLQDDRVLALVVTFEPELAVLERCIRALRGQGLQVLLVDNGSRNAERVAELARTNGCRLIGNATNRGIARALNQGLAAARVRGMRWLWTFDQDTEILPTARKAMTRVIENLRARDHVALVGIAHIDRQTGRDYQSNSRISGPTGEIQVSAVITSGCMVNVDAANELGAFDERLFIDGVDHEFCMRARCNGWRLLRAVDSAAIHSMGELKRHELGPIVLHSTNHSALRRYYMARNTLAIVFRYSLRAPGQCLRLLAVLGATALTIALFERQKLVKITALVLGVMAYCRGESGAAPARVVERLRRPPSPPSLGDGT